MTWTTPVNLATGDKVTDAIWNLQVIDNLLYLYNRRYDFVCVQDQKVTNTAGGTFNNAAWRTRDINTEVADIANICTVAGNQITLLTGQYICLIYAPAFRVDQNQARLQNITAGTTLLWGSGAFSANAASYALTTSFISGYFTLTASTVLEVQHMGTTSIATNGFGVAANFAGNVEVYTTALFWRIQV